jgi:hypothetical protein
MEQRISYLIGCDIATPDPTREPAGLEGGFFGIESNVPSALRGSADGFCASILIRSRSAIYQEEQPVGIEFLAGSRDFVNDTGWAFMLNGPLVIAMVGDAQCGIISGEPIKDMLVTVVLQGTDVLMYINGLLVDSSELTLPFQAGPDNFGVGGTSDASYVTALADAAYGAINVHIGGVMVGPAIDMSETFVTNSPLADQYNTVFFAADMVDVEPSLVPAAGPLFPEASYLWSVRRGLPEIADNGNEKWADQVHGLELSRLGTQIGTTVSAHAPDWFDAPLDQTPPS